MLIPSLSQLVRASAHSVGSIRFLRMQKEVRKAFIRVLASSNYEGRDADAKPLREEVDLFDAVLRDHVEKLCAPKASRDQEQA